MRRRFTFFTFLWMIAPLLVYWGAIRFGLLPRGLVSVDRTEVDSDIDRGIDALHQGDSHRADDAFAQAVAAQGGGSGAYVAVATRLMQGAIAPAAAQAVVNLLLPATKDSTLSWDPMLWATLADAYRRADDKAKATESDVAAERTAQAIFAAGGAKSADLSADEQATRLEEVSIYYNERKKDPARAIETLRMAIALPLGAPELAGIRNDLGYLLADKGKTTKEYTEAVRLTRQAVDATNVSGINRFTASFTPEASAEYLDSYGWALFKNGDREGARRVLTEAAGDLPTEPEIHYHLGVVHAALNEPADAAVELDRAIHLQPSFPEATAARTALPSLPSTPAMPTPRPSPSGFSLTPPTASPSAVPSPTPAAATPSPKSTTPSPIPSAATPSSALKPSPAPSPPASVR